MEKEPKVKVLEGFGKKYPVFQEYVGSTGKVIGEGKSGTTKMVQFVGTQKALFIEPEFLEAV